MNKFNLKVVTRAAGVVCLFAVVTVAAVTFRYFIPDFFSGITGAASERDGQALILIEDESTPMADSPESKVLKPVASGKKTESGEGANIDMSNASEGYIMVKYTGGGGKIKVLISKGGKTAYQYDLNSSGEYEVFPLTQGNGSYTINVYQNAGGNQYALLLAASVRVELRASTLPFLYPNQFVNFNEKSQAVQKSNQLVQGETDQLSMVKAIYEYVVTNTSYDTQKAANVKPGYLPVVDTILNTKKGICFDYASLTAAMLRAQGIPARLEVGYAGKAYHAWISVYINEVGWLNNMIYFDGKSWKLMDPTFASGGGQSKEIMQYIGNGSNYSTVYMY